MNNDQIPELPKMNNSLNNNQQTINNTVQISNNNEVNFKTDITVDKKSFKEFFKDVRKYITSRNSSELFSLLWRLLLVAGFVIVLFVPFQIFMDLGINLFILFGIDFTSTIATIWDTCWYIIYGVTSIILFFVLCKERYYKLIKYQEEKNKLESGNKN